MFNVSEAPSVIHIHFASELRYVERVIREMQYFLGIHGCDSFLEINIIVRELLRNAVEHGNLGIAGRRVSFLLEMTDDDRCRITVEDEGEGFACRRFELPADHSHRGRQSRGLALVRELAEHLEFNERGNRVIVLARAYGKGAGRQTVAGGQGTGARPQT